MYRGACMCFIFERATCADLAVTWSIGGFVITSITVLACASPDYNSARYALFVLLGAS